MSLAALIRQAVASDTWDKNSWAAEEIGFKELYWSIGRLVRVYLRLPTS